jgi:hypothetical protein
MLDMERIVHIVACMYGQNAEAVINIGRGECYLFLGQSRNELSVSEDEIFCLEENGIIEFDSGNNEKGHETQVYRLTEEAQRRIKAILNNKKLLQLRE